MDFSKAFDKLDHDLLTYKLNSYGITGNVNHWIKNFLSNRQQAVIVEGEKSDFGPVTSGVPQGSVLGPTLFLFYINDIANELDSTVRLFADDTMVYLVIKSQSDAKKLQKDLNCLGSWEKEWRMEFHPDKCSVLSITRSKTPIHYEYQLHGQPLEHVKSAKYLGVTIQSDLKWTTHVNTVTNKANRTLGFLLRNLKISSPAIKEKAYKSLVRRSPEYASSVWDPYTENLANQVEMVQRRAARFTLNRYQYTASVSMMLNHLQWKSLKERWRDSRLCMLYKIRSNLVEISCADLKAVNRLSRYTHSGAYIPMSCSRDYRKYSFYPRTVID